MSTSHQAQPPLRIGFIHPDLGIGGAERLVVDAAVSLQQRGHEVVVFTSRHDPSRCFEETTDGTLEVHVLGDTIFPRNFMNAFNIIFASLRQIHLTFLLVLSIYLPFRIPHVSPLAPLDSFDVFVVDQLSVCVPLLRWLGQTRVVFYCHFPDKLLSGGWEISSDRVGRKRLNPRDAPAIRTKAPSLLKRLYRWPFDKLEEITTECVATGEADIVLANSKFTSRIYHRAFPSLREVPKVVYPCINLDAYSGSSEDFTGDDVDLVKSDRPTFLSLNRFEGKKNVALAVEAFNKAKEASNFDKNTRLVIGGEYGGLNLLDRNISDVKLVPSPGGYDDKLEDNIQTLTRLRTLCDHLGLSHVTLSPSSGTAMTASPTTDVIFLLNFTTNQRSYLLLSRNTLGLLYTPQNEHFGIVPVEAMACGLPVLAVNNGGPTETVVDTGDDMNADSSTGLLREPNLESWSQGISIIAQLSQEKRDRIARAGKQRVRDLFSLNNLGREMEDACRRAKSLGPVGAEEMFVLTAGTVLLAFIMLLMGLVFPFL
ncbi:hypothetical protein QFC19_001814 [Naganishia cerealis]|uniref:Uncharacterized protein n=2 Tax=Naganishia cerealis TaxID=610337 RepID=A0ACC2VYQ2_9TREE|nr:hypothetical protein QFC19_004141 [Naganishia cerealis]KAJ9109835.1 hypothetical protein QFC19_001814 [Naganishia cerealis]